MKKKYKVRRGYTLFLKGKTPVVGPAEVELEENEIIGQEWKVELISADVKEPQRDRALKSPAKRSKK